MIGLRDTSVYLRESCAEAFAFAGQDPVVLGRGLRVPRDRQVTTLLWKEPKPAHSSSLVLVLFPSILSLCISAHLPGSEVDGFQLVRGLPVSDSELRKSEGDRRCHDTHSGISSKQKSCR